MECLTRFYDALQHTHCLPIIAKLSVFKAVLFPKLGGD